MGSGEIATRLGNHLQVVDTCPPLEEDAGAANVADAAGIEDVARLDALLTGHHSTNQNSKERTR